MLLQWQPSELLREVSYSNPGRSSSYLWNIQDLQKKPREVALGSDV
jgi:hypothetical protein